MISKYIKSLIDIHSRVIVPDLGAFMLKGDSSKVIYFNEFLRFNDGLLVDYIAEQEQIDKIEAAKKVKVFVDDANKQLSNNKSVDLGELGTLYLDVNEKIQLKTSESIAPQVSKPVEPEVETTPREILFELEKTEPAPVQTKTPEPPPVPKPQATPVSKPKVEPVAEAPVKEVKPPAASEVKPKQATVAPPKKDNVTIDVVPTTTRRMVIVGIIGVLVIGAIVYFAFFRSPVKDPSVNQNITIGADSNSRKQDSSAKTKPIENSAKTKAVDKIVDTKHKVPIKPGSKANTDDSKTKVVAVPATKVEPPKSIVKTTTGKKFYVIAGTFSVESNADKLFKKLKEQGYQPDKIRNDIKNVFYVSFSSFADKGSATQEIKKLKSAGTDAWIYFN